VRILENQEWLYKLIFSNEVLIGDCLPIYCTRL
jgi:hypothetical protein